MQEAAQSPAQIEIRDRLIVALDVRSVGDARALVAKLGDAVSFYKIGYGLAFSGGLELARELKAEGRKVFLDLKLLDIDNTIERGVESILPLGIDMLTLHAYPKAMRAAVRATAGSPVCLLGVTALTSMDDADLAEAGFAFGARDLVERRARQAAEAGMGGVVCSPLEARRTREICGPDMAVVTPGIRPAGSDAGDQKRVTTPADAISSGASHIVVGRPVTAAPDPAGAAMAILDEIDSQAG